MSERQTAVGKRTICTACGEPIEYIGPHWRHVGEAQPRHIAQPREPALLTCEGCGRQVGALWNGLCTRCIYLEQ